MARGSGDDKYMAGGLRHQFSFATSRKATRPDRDIIVALEDRRGRFFDSDALGIQWLLQNHRDPDRWPNSR